MIIQINATVCVAVDHGEGGRFKIAGRDQRKMGRKAKEGGQLPGETTISKSAVEMPVLAADAGWRGQ